MRPPLNPSMDPFSTVQWDMAMIDADFSGSYRYEQGSHDVIVGVIDTGIEANHPDIAPNFNRELSRNFTVDDPIVDGAQPGQGVAIGAAGRDLLAEDDRPGKEQDRNDA